MPRNSFMLESPGAGQLALTTLADRCEAADGLRSVKAQVDAGNFVTAASIVDRIAGGERDKAVTKAAGDWSGRTARGGQFAPEDAIRSALRLYEAVLRRGGGPSEEIARGADGTQSDRSCVCFF